MSRDPLKPVRVRVLPERALSIQDAKSRSSQLYRAGEELELPDEHAELLIADGIVEKH